MGGAGGGEGTAGWVVGGVFSGRCGGGRVGWGGGGGRRGSLCGVEGGRWGGGGGVGVGGVCGVGR